MTDLKVILDDLLTAYNNDLSEFVSGHLYDSCSRKNDDKNTKKHIWSSVHLQNDKSYKKINEKDQNFDGNLKIRTLKESIAKSGSRTSRSLDLPPLNRNASIISSGERISYQSKHCELKDGIEFERSAYIPKIIDHERSNRNSKIIQNLLKPSLTKQSQFYNMKNFQNEFFKEDKDKKKHNELEDLWNLVHEKSSLLSRCNEKDIEIKFKLYCELLNKTIHKNNDPKGSLDIIKEGYERYFYYLLRKCKESQIRDSSSEMDDEKSIELQKQLKAEMLNYSILEQNALDLLNENERLRNELDCLTKYPDISNNKDEINPVIEQNKLKSKTEQLEELQNQLMDKIDAIESLNSHLKSNCVPITDFEVLNQCVCDTETELSYLQKQEEDMLHKIDDMRLSLKMIVDESESTAEDKRFVFEKMMHRLEHEENLLNGLNIDIENDKWSWYIS